MVSLWLSTEHLFHMQNVPGLVYSIARKKDQVLGDVKDLMLKVWRAAVRVNSNDVDKLSVQGKM